jgi:lipopolysaccharide export system permease protein
MFRATMGAFLITLVSLTVVIWFTQAMRDFDLITSQPQTLLVFVGITGMIIPLLVMMIAPIALVIATAHVLNKLSSDSEIIVMNAAASPWRLLRPFLAAALVVSLLVGIIAAYLSPRSLRELRDWGAQVRADILTDIVQPGRFTTIGGNLTFHIADRKQNGLLVGIFVDDRRDSGVHSTYLAEQGEIVKNDAVRRIRR